MKNNLVFKFLAVILCAASLTVTYGGIAGVAVLSSADLYNKTADQVEQEQLDRMAEQYAYTLALAYASTELGGCPEDMVNQLQASYHTLPYTYDTYGYRILDADGTVLSAYNDQGGFPAVTYTFPASGQYMHLVSTQREQDLREAAAPAAASVEALPADLSQGLFLTQATFFGRDGGVLYEACSQGSEIHTYGWLDDSSSLSDMIDGNHAGFLLQDQQGQLVFTAAFREPVYPASDREIFGYLFFDTESGFFLEEMSDQPLGILSRRSDGSLRFVSAAQEPVPETTQETIPETTAATVPETTAEAVETTAGETTAVTVPETMAETTVMETVPETTTAATGETTQETAAAETVPSAASALPESSHPPVTEPTISETAAAESFVVETAGTLTIPGQTQPEELVLINGKPLDEYQVNSDRYWDGRSQSMVDAKYVYIPMPALTVEIFVDPESSSDAVMYDMMALLRELRGYLLPAIGIGLFVFAVFAVYLCTAAGRKPKTDEVRAAGLNRLPLDLYLCAAGFGIALIAVYAAQGTPLLLERDLLVGCGFLAAAGFFASLLVVGFCYAFVAQLKTPGGYWYRNTLCGHALRLTVRFGKWLEGFLGGVGGKGFPAMGKLLKRAWKFLRGSVVWIIRTTEAALTWTGRVLGRFFRRIGRILGRWLNLMPLTWQWTVTGMILFCMTLVAATTRSEVMTGLCLIAAIGLILYGAHCFGVLLESTKHMSKGDLDTKVDDKLMVGCFREFAEDLNDLADVAMVAAQKQLKSERMKTELITNVSHDIKTPLTSIINYVDLLQKPHTDEEEAQYLEVLDRQSQRLKKLIDDLMEMSKANTGNMQVDITCLDAVESVNQALGEFAGKLEAAALIPVFRHEESQVLMMADGRLVWRVMSNLLSNAVKYAMPGTRLYIDLAAMEDKVVISLKNISREELNVDAEELMERFVRGDDSRNTEGSGLGLNIAKSLMELQRGQLQLLVDGDLFKVTLIFPGA